MNTPQTWAQIGFEVEITGDGSPTLRLMPGECMHHSGGAAAETELIYGRVIHHCFAKIENPHFLSVGLGLGYVEMSVAREALLKQNLNFTLESFELVPELREYLKRWLKGQSLSPEITSVYESVLKYVLKGCNLNPEELKRLLVAKLEFHQWHLQGPLLSESEFMAKAHCLLFDAFSAKTSPDLWSEEFLVAFFKRAMAANSLVSTYASRGALKRALKTAGFAVETQEGFKGKRNSTMAFQGAISLPAGTFSHTQ
jgi:S-adenosylmethionine-dependent methyltransferase